MAEEEENGVSIEPEFPKGRVKKIMTLDKDVKRVSSEALFLVSRSTELFLQFLAEKSAQVAIGKKRKTVNLEHIRTAVKRHQPTRDFLLDELPPPSQPQPISPLRLRLGPNSMPLRLALAVSIISSQSQNLKTQPRPKPKPTASTHG
ncbi:Dr1-associated corepressor-like [Spatholobus suberectus]|nr:Dr1-associated corepressor-like [Spatholobus suberectus]